LAGVFVLACSDDLAPLPATSPAPLGTTLAALAGLGAKRVGTAQGMQAGDWVLERMTTIGLAHAHTEPFQFPRQDVAAATLVIAASGTSPVPAPTVDALDGTGTGQVEGQLIYVGSATPSDLAAHDPRGRIALVDRSLALHRAIQYENLVGAGALAMVQISVAPDNLRQVGSVRKSCGDQMGPIPAVVIGHDDGAALQSLLANGMPGSATVAVDATMANGTGRNVVGQILGSDPSAGQIVIGAHYDTWFAGSIDNGGGLAALLALAERRSHEAKLRRTLTIVAYDGEEVGLYGGYDFLRKHSVLAATPIVAFLNLEMPAAKDATVEGLARSNEPALDRALRGAGLAQLYSLYLAMDIVPTIFGGIIPTDIQGAYRSGIPTASTAADSSYYHTIADTPDKVDLPPLAAAVDAFDRALSQLDVLDSASLAGPDPKLWRAEVSLAPRTSADPLLLEIALSDGAGAPQAGSQVTAQLMVDDFFGVATQSGVSDAQGHASLQFAAADINQGSGGRFVHITAGPTYPLVEKIIALP
jgi:hypothetical protein